jgi:hypothetical protein
MSDDVAEPDGAWRCVETVESAKSDWMRPGGKEREPIISAEIRRSRNWLMGKARPICRDVADHDAAALTARRERNPRMEQRGARPWRIRSKKSLPESVSGERSAHRCVAGVSRSPTTTDNVEIV